MTAVTGNPAITGWLCLRLFQSLVHDSYVEPRKPETVLDIDEAERDIVEYVGGVVVRKLIQRTKRLQACGEKDYKLQCLNCLKLDKEAEEIGKENMTAILDRGGSKGGLIHVKPNVLQMFMQMEEKFRRSDNKESTFVENCTNSDSVTLPFYDTLYCLDISKNVLEDIFDCIVCLYFKIRIHHRLNRVMDKGKTEWRAKSLRKTLAKK